ncbi:MAG: hypothetical protein MHPSP_001623, partial [Paramarteilia canceri]
PSPFEQLAMMLGAFSQQMGAANTPVPSATVYSQQQSHNPTNMEAQQISSANTEQMNLQTSDQNLPGQYLNSQFSNVHQPTDQTEINNSCTDGARDYTLDWIEYFKSTGQTEQAEQLQKQYDESLQKKPKVE